MKNNCLKFIITFLLLPCFVFALEVSYPTVSGTGLGESPSLTDLVKYAFNFAVAIGSVIAFMVIVYQGFNIANSGGEAAKIDAAKNKIRDAFIGLVVILASYIILTAINPGLIAIQGISLQPFIPGAPETPPETETPETGAGTVNFQEIPLGTVTENALASNIGCLDADNNLLDCRTGKIIECYYENGNIMNSCKVEGSEEPKIKDLYAVNNSITYCYNYDSNGDKSDVLDVVGGRDRLDCFNNLLIAYQAKMEVLQTYLQDLYTAMNQCTCSRCVGGSWSPATNCPGGCFSNCKCATGSYKDGTDPCPNRAEIDAKRERIKQLVNGGLRDDPYYDWHMNPYPDPEEKDPVKKLEYNSKFMTLEIFQTKISGFKNLLQADYNAMKDAEKLMKNNSQNIISLAQLQNIQYYENQSISITPFEELNNQKTDKYCRDFNNELNSLGRICKIVDEKERYVFDGDGANFYYAPGFSLSSAYSEATNTIKQCALGDSSGISPIPIGETVDGAETLVSEIIDKVDNIIIRGNTAIGVALTNANSAYNLPESCECTNCVSRMQELRYQCCTNCLEPLFLQREHCIEAACVCDEKSSEERVCPFNSFASREADIENIIEGIDENLLSISGLTSSSKSVILNKLSVSRVKLESCVSGYGVAAKPDIMQTRLFNCQDGLLAVHLQGLVITPGFPWPAATGYYNCYPFNSSELTSGQKQECYRNFTGEGNGDKCQDFIRNLDLISNYYCCRQPI